MPVQEITFVGQRIEVYVRIDTDTKDVLDVYWGRKCSFRYDNRKEGGREVKHKDGRNPLFVHAVNPQKAFDVAYRDFNVATSDIEFLQEYVGPTVEVR
jgi:hypothetical protein